MDNLVPIHNHTNYSKLDGLSTIDEIGQRARDIGIEAIAITDHDVVAGRTL